MIRSLLIATLLVVSPIVIAEPGNPGQGFDRVVERLQLDNARADELRTIFREGNEARRALRESYREQHRALKESQREKVEGVLTEEELKALKDMMKKHRKKMRRHHHGKHRYKDFRLKD